MWPPLVSKLGSRLASAVRLADLLPPRRSPRYPASFALCDEDGGRFNEVSTLRQEARKYAAEGR